MLDDDQSQATPIDVDSLHDTSTSALAAEAELPNDNTLLPEGTSESTLKPARGIAPLWHMLVLVVAVLAFSYFGAGSSTPEATSAVSPGATQATADGKASSDLKDVKEATDTGVDRLRLIRYALTATVELAMVAWVLVGLRLRRVSFRSLFGTIPRGLNAITMEILVAALFWICAMGILVVAAFSWQFVQDRIYQHEIKVEDARNGSSHEPESSVRQKSKSNPDSNSANTPEGSKSTELKSPQKQQAEMVRKLMTLAPANGLEIAAWGVLCLLVGWSEELVFRGYLQTQAIAWLRFTPAGVAFSALVFGLAHGYQGLRGMCIITLYGVLFSGIALLRRNLLPDMIAHSWHDFATGMLLALVRSTHLLDRAPFA